MSNSWAGYHILLNPDYSAQILWRFVNRAIDEVENHQVTCNTAGLLELPRIRCTIAAELGLMHILEACAVQLCKGVVCSQGIAMSRSLCLRLFILICCHMQ